jgi:hypothetical protein
VGCFYGDEILGTREWTKIGAEEVGIYDFGSGHSIAMASGRVRGGAPRCAWRFDVAAR